MKLAIRKSLHRTLLRLRYPRSIPILFAYYWRQFRGIKPEGKIVYYDR